MKDERNGWEFTPKVRIDVMDAYGYDFEKNHVEDEFPIKRTEYTKLYLDAESKSMSLAKVEKESEAVYDNYLPAPRRARSPIHLRRQHPVTVRAGLRL
jgi:predicted acyl esterase